MIIVQYYADIKYEINLNQSGHNALTCAITGNHFSVMQYLIEKASMDVNSKTNVSIYSLYIV